MAAMASITRPGACATPIVNGSILPPRTQTLANCRVSSRRGQLSVESSSSSSSSSRIARLVVVRAVDEGFFPSSSSGSVVGQTPATTAPIDTANSTTSTSEVKDDDDAQPIEPPAAKAPRKPSPLEKGGTLADKDPAIATVGKKASAVSDAAKFDDPRWRAGTWDITKFTSNARIDWDAVIDAEVARRKWLEENPEASNNSEPVVFDTATVPWWAWVKRFHLPEAELLNGRAAMVGLGVGYLVDLDTGAGLVDQQSTFLGKTLLLLTVLGVLLVRTNGDVANLKTIARESTFYDKQWQATWKDDDDNDNKDNTAVANDKVKDEVKDADSYFP